MKNYILLSIAFFVFASGTTAFGQKVGAEWTHPKYTDPTYSKIAVVAIGRDPEAQKLFESLAVRQLRKKRINAVMGSAIFAPISPESRPSRKQIIEIIRKNKLDGVITMTLVKTIDSVKHIPGRVYSVGVGNRVLGIYMVTNYKTMSEPGDIVFTKSYLIEANLFDLKGEIFEGKDTLVWKGQSTLVDPKSKKSAAREFTKPMIKHLLKRGIVKRKVTKKGK